MNSQPTPIAPTTESVGNALSGITNSASSAISGLTDSISGARSSLNTAVSDFSSKSAVDASNEFLESNTIVAKFAFIIVALIGFMLLFRLGAIILGYFFMPTGSPYLVKGMIGGSESKIIKQDPKTDFPLVKISDNAETGIEFTYSVWLNLSGETTPDVYKHVFSKGTGTTANTYAVTDIYIPNYTSSNYKSYSVDAVQETMGTSPYVYMQSGLWANTSAITSITFTENGEQKLFLEISAMGS